MEKIERNNLLKKANSIRKEVVENCVKSGAGHIAPSLSCIDILTALYYNVLNIDYTNSQWEERDRVIFSKAHGCYGLYAILADIGFVPRDEWLNFYNGSSLAGCVERNLDFAIEAGCGSLGHGLPMAVGIAFGAKLQKKMYNTYCIVGDGEMQEGSNWEAIQMAVKYELSHLTLIIDHNQLQAMDYLDTVLTVKGRSDDLEQKLKAFGFQVKTCDGHSLEDIVSVLNEFKNSRFKNKAPKVLIARTIKGYGLKCMENIPKFHFCIPTEEEIQLGNRYE